MAIIEKRVDDFNCPFTNSEVLVIGSGHARVTKAYYHFLEKLKINNYFLNLNQGLIESLAYNLEKDRTHFYHLLKKNFKKKIKQIIIFTDICADGKGSEQYQAKRERRKAAAINAQKNLVGIFTPIQSDLLVLSFIITVDGENRYLDILAEEVEKSEEACG